MQIPDYLSKGSAEGYLERITFARQPNDDEETQLGLFDATIDLVLDLKDQVVDEHPRYLRGAKEAILAAKDGKGTTRVRYEPLDRERNIRLSLARGEQWVVFTDVGAEVRVLEVIATAESPRFQCKVKVTGLSSDQCGRLLETWKKSVDTIFEPVQLSLPTAA